MKTARRTYQQQFDEAIACTDKKQADRWLALEITRYQQAFGHTKDQAKEVILENLGYIAGYYDHETAQKVYHLFGAVHPIFGTATYHQDVTPESAFRAGQTIGGMLKKAQ